MTCTFTKVQLNPDVLAAMAQYAKPQYQPGDMTVESALSQWQYPNTQAGKLRARRLLEEMVEDGVFEKIKDVILPNGKSGNAYRLIKKESGDESKTQSHRRN